AIIKQSVVYGTYENAVNRESAAEILRARAAQRTGGAPVAPAAIPATPATPSAPRPLPSDPRASQPAAPTGGGWMDALGGILFGTTGPRGGHHEGLVEVMAKT